MKKKKKRDPNLITEYVGTPIPIENPEMEMLTEEELQKKKEKEEKKD